MKEWWVDWVKWLLSGFATIAGLVLSFGIKQFLKGQKRERAIEKLADALAISLKRADNQDAEIKELKLMLTNYGQYAEKIRNSEEDIRNARSDLSELGKRVTDVEKTTSYLKGRTHD